MCPRATQVTLFVALTLNVVALNKYKLFLAARLWLFVFFWARPPFTLLACHWATELTMSKLPKHLSATCKDWHKPPVTRFLNSPWWRAALGKECAVCRSFHPRETASILLRCCVSEKCNWCCMWSLQIFFSFSKSVSSLSLHSSAPSRPHGVHRLHPVVLARTVWP